MLAPCCAQHCFPSTTPLPKKYLKLLSAILNSFRQTWKHKKTNNLRIVEQGRSRSNLLQEQDRTVISLRSSVACMHAHIRGRKNAPRWRLLTTVMGYCLCTELQKRGSFSHFPISPSRVRSARFHITADSKPRRRETGALKSPHSTRPASCAQHPCVVTHGQGE